MTIQSVFVVAFLLISEEVLITSYRLIALSMIPQRRARLSSILHTSPTSPPHLSLPFQSRDSTIEIYSTVGCKYCRIAKAKLLELGLTEWIDIDINSYDSVQSQEKLSAISRERLLHARQNTVPQIYVGSTRIGGCDNLLGSH